MTRSAGHASEAEQARERALCALRVFVYQDPPAEVYRLADMPWCIGDLSWLKKLTLCPWMQGGRRWRPAFL